MGYWSLPFYSNKSGWAGKISIDTYETYNSDSFDLKYRVYMWKTSGGTTTGTFNGTLYLKQGARTYDYDLYYYGSVTAGGEDERVKIDEGTRTFTFNNGSREIGIEVDIDGPSGTSLSGYTLVTENPDTGEDYTITVTRPSPPSYTLSLNAGTGSTISVTRTSSPYAGASTGVLSNGSTIYAGDTINISFGANTGYNLSTCTVNGSSFSGGSYTVSGNISVISNASVKQYSLSMLQDDNITIVVNRISSPLKGAITGNILSGDIIYYNDVLNIAFESTENENLLSTVNGISFESGYSHTVTSDVHVAVINSNKAKSVYIYNGTNYDRYLTYIYDGFDWNLYTPYAYVGTEWVEINPDYKIIVTVDSGSTVTAICESDNKVATEDNGTYTISGLYPGNWYVSAIKDGQEVTSNIVVIEQSKLEYYVTLQYNYYIIKDGILVHTDIQEDGYREVDDEVMTDVGGREFAYQDYSRYRIEFYRYYDYYKTTLSFKILNVPLTGYSKIVLVYNSNSKIGGYPENPYPKLSVGTSSMSVPEFDDGFNPSINMLPDTFNTIELPIDNASATGTVNLFIAAASEESELQYYVDIKDMYFEV